MSLFLSHISLRSVLQLFFIATLIICAGWYASYQARNLLAGPEIALTHEPAPLQSSRTVLLEGTAENIVSLTVNGNPIFTDEEGRFKKELVLENGYTIMTLQATDRFGRIKSLTRQFVYTPVDPTS